MKSKTIGFLLDLTQLYTSVLFGIILIELLPENELLNSHYAAYSRVAGTCFPTLCTWTRLSIFVSNSTSLNLAIGAGIVKVLNYFPWPLVVYIDTNDFLFVVQ